MANDWIKIRSDLATDPDVMKMSDILGQDDSATVGQLVFFWSWLNSYIDPTKPVLATTSNRIDRLIRKGFADALRAVGWLDGEEGALLIPNYERHNGNNAKARALESEAKRLRRMSDNTSDKRPTKKGRKVRPEKRREEKRINIPPNPLKRGNSLSRLSLSEKKKRKYPTITEGMKRLGALFGRKPETKWTIYEAESYNAICPNEEDVNLIERFYALRSKQGDGPDLWKHDLSTLLNQWTAQIDRANQKCKVGKANTAEPVAIPEPPNWRERGFVLWPQKGSEYWSSQATWPEMIANGCARELELELAVGE